MEQSKALLLEVDDDISGGSKKQKGLMGMKFMQKAVERQRRNARSEAQTLVNDLETVKNGDHNDSSYDLFRDQPKDKKTNLIKKNGQETIGKQRFGGNKNDNPSLKAFNENDKQYVTDALAGEQLLEKVQLNCGTSTRVDKAITISATAFQRDKQLSVAGEKSNHKSIKVKGKKSSAQNSVQGSDNTNRKQQSS